MKANNRHQKGNKTHAQSNEYKIPYRDRKAFMGANIKWVSRKKYMKYLDWKKEKKDTIW